MYNKELGACAVLTLALAMEIAPLVWDNGFFTPLESNSPLISRSEPPIPVPNGSPPWIIKPLIMRWKVSPS